MVNALNPKSSLLTKLAEIATAYLDDGDDPSKHDPEVVEWLNRMAELEFVPARPVHATGGTFTIEENFRDGVTKVVTEPIRFDASQDEIQEAVDKARSRAAALPRVGYQICATLRGATGTDEASYAEKTSTDDALRACLMQFPVESGYTNHYVKNFETQVETYLDQTKLVKMPAPISSLSLLDDDEPVSFSLED